MTKKMEETIQTAYAKHAFEQKKSSIRFIRETTIQDMGVASNAHANQESTPARGIRTVGDTVAEEHGMM